MDSRGDCGMRGVTGLGEGNLSVIVDVMEFLPDATFVIDRKGKVVAWNRAIEEMSGVAKERMLGKSENAYAVPFYGEPRPMLIDLIFTEFSGEASPYDFVEWRGGTLYAEAFVPGTYGGKGAFLCGTASPIFDKDGRLIGAIEAMRDFSHQKSLERALLAREKDLEEKARELEDANTALKVLLKQREKDRKDLEDRILTNVKESILPFLERLKQSRMDKSQKAYLAMVESELFGLVSPFVRYLSKKLINLTPMEIRVAKLIKDGKLSKEIADLLGLAEKTVLTHRNNLRKKLGLRNKKANLRSHLMSLI
ncbi:MAG: LuxR C-terminal-related transcriptional regulator [Syntrophobacter sp.]